MSPDASALLDRLTLIQTGKIRGSGLVMERLKRGYSRITFLLTAEGGCLTMMAVMITIKSLRKNVN